MMDFELNGDGDFTGLMQESGIVSFNDACRFIATIPYQRISNKKDLALVFHERRGTCSSKHAFLKVLADEQGKKDVELVLRYFKMNEQSHTCLKQIFETIALEYIPEAHVCLKYQNKYYDFTTRNFPKLDAFVLKEEVIDVSTLLEEKDSKHFDFIKDWNKSEYSTDQIWKWREACIALLSKQ